MKEILVTCSILVTAIILVGSLIAVQAKINDKTKENYFECLEKTEQRTCNAIFYPYKTKDL